jgi:hypothetical protein
MAELGRKIMPHLIWRKGNIWRTAGVLSVAFVSVIVLAGIVVANVNLDVSMAAALSRCRR